MDSKNHFQPSAAQRLSLMQPPEAVRAALEGVVTIDESQRITMSNAAAQRMFLRTEQALRGASLWELMPVRFRQAQQARVQRFMARAAAQRAMEQVFHVVGLRSNGEEFALYVVMCKLDLSTEHGPRHCFIALLFERSEVCGLNQTIECLNHQMRPIFDLVPVVIWITDGERIVFANQACCTLFDVHTPADLVGRSVHDLLRSETGGSLKGQIGQALASEDAVSSLRARVVRRHGETLEVELVVGALPEHHSRLVQMVITDITPRSQERRDLLLSRRTLRELSASIVDAREAERKRIARELHDELGQRLMALKLELSMLAQAEGQRTGAERIQTVIDMLDDTLASVRRIAVGLRPPMLDDLGLNAAIEWLVSGFRQHHALQIDLAMKPAQAVVPPDVAITLYRILQEALTNIVRHAGAQKVRVGFAQTASGWRLVVQDDGVGFAHTGAPTRRGSFGLIGMRERLLLLDGTLSIRNLASGGARLDIRIPRRTTNAPHEPEAVDPVELASQNEALQRIQRALAATRDGWPCG